MSNSAPKMVYHFSKPGFAEHQSPKLLDHTIRKSILMDKNFATHPKVTMLAEKKDPVAFLILFHVWARLDLESGSWAMRTDLFDHWVRRTFNRRNRFSVQNCLDSLVETDLLHYRIVPLSEFEGYSFED